VVLETECGHDARLGEAAVPGVASTGDAGQPGPCFTYPTCLRVERRTGELRYDCELAGELG
jgi:hypothetical protein